MRELELTFTGKGEVRGFQFRQLDRTPHGYLYEVTCNNDVHYEVFRRKVNERFNVVSYPKSGSFGVSAWACNTLAEAREKLAAISQPKKKITI